MKFFEKECVHRAQGRVGKRFLVLPRKFVHRCTSATAWFWLQNVDAEVVDTSTFGDNYRIVMRVEDYEYESLWVTRRPRM